MHATSGGLACRGQDDVLVLSRAGREVAVLGAAPVIEGRPARITGWEPDGSEAWTGALDTGGRVRLEVEQGLLSYRLETDLSCIRELTYFPGSRVCGKRWHTFVSDEWDRTWDSDQDVRVAASSNYLGMSVDESPYGEEADGAGMTDPGDRVPTWIFNIPAHMAAFETGPGDWWGMSLPRPHAMGAARWRMERGVFSLSLDAVQASCPESGCPTVYLHAGLDEPYALCDRHYDLSAALGLTRREVRADHPDWWAHPYYKSYDDMLRTQAEEGGYEGHFKEVDGKLCCAISAERVRRWHAAVEAKTRLAGRVNMLFDQVYFYRYGDYRSVIDELGGAAGLRELIDGWRARGVRTGLYFHPFTVSKDTPFYRTHPEACLEPNRPGIVYRHGVRVGASETTYFDWTHPAARDYLLDTVEFLLSDGPGCLNADWLAVNNTIGPDPRFYDFHNPDWGTGDLAQRKTMRLVYERAKAVKPDCFVRRQSALAPYMEPFYDEAQLCEEWNGSTRNWWRRARIATRLIRHDIMGFDPWFVTLTKAYEYYHGLAVVCVPATEASSHAIHPYLGYRPLKEKDFRRREAGMQAYLNAPQRISDERRVELGPGGEFAAAWRKRTEGPLAGFHAALAISPRCQVTYSETQAMISASESRTVEVPLPPGARLQGVERVGHDGAIAGHEYASAPNNRVRLQAEDAAGETLLVRIRYRNRRAIG